MNPSRRLFDQVSQFKVLVSALLLMCLAACSSTPTADADFDDSYDFSGVQKIAIQPFDRTATASVVVSDIQVSRINKSIKEELQRKGFQVVDDSAQADMLLSWHLVTQERADVRSYNSVSAYNCWRCGPRYGAGVGVGVSDVSVRYYTQGTFIVDMIDPVKLQSVWRSVFESRIRDNLKPEEAAENRRAAVQAIFAEFPPVPAAE
ncbi:MAG: hypothetical protein Hals2KO_20320 [Halioglobus sp.]